MEEGHKIADAKLLVQFRPLIKTKDASLMSMVMEHSAHMKQISLTLRALAVLPSNLTACFSILEVSVSLP